MASDKFWYKENENDEILWLDNGTERIGEFVFSFDGQKEYNLFRDYPHELSEEERKIFDKENPFWADFFKDRR